MSYYDPKVKIAIPDHTLLLPDEFVLEGSDNKSALGKSWGALAIYAMDRRKILWGMVPSLANSVKRLGGHIQDETDSLRSLSDAKVQNPEMYLEGSTLEQIRQMKIERINVSHEEAILSAFIVNCDKAEEWLSPFCVSCGP